MVMAAKRDYYDVLGVARTASQSDIAEAYRKLALQYHPDRSPGDEDAVRNFKEAAEAFEVLNDPDKRARYDHYGHAAFDGPGGGAPQFADISEIFEAFGDIFGGGLFGDLFGGGRRGRRARRGGNVRCDVAVDLFEAARGVTKSIEFSRHRQCAECGGSGARKGSTPETCSYCGGPGQVVQSSGILRVQTTCPSCRGSGQQIKDRCGQCRGQGYVRENVTREVAIPAGIDDQMQVRLRGEGEPSPSGGSPGDCYCTVHVTQHSLFQRDGLNLLCRVPVTYSQAALGATIEVPTLDGPEEFEIPRGTQPGDVFTLRRRGMPDPRGRHVGDLYVQVDIDVPKKLNARQEELLRELADVEKKNVTPHRKSFLKKLQEYFVGDAAAEKMGGE